MPRDEHVQRDANGAHRLVVVAAHATRGSANDALPCASNRRSDERNGHSRWNTHKQRGADHEFSRSRPLRRCLQAEREVQGSKASAPATRTGIGCHERELSSIQEQLVCAEPDSGERNVPKENARHGVNLTRRESARRARCRWAHQMRPAVRADSDYRPNGTSTLRADREPESVGQSNVIRRREPRIATPVLRVHRRITGQ